MKWGELKKNKGTQVKLAPPACHLNDFGEPLLPAPDEAWTIVSVQDDAVLLSAPSGHSIRLAKDHICNSVPSSPRAEEAADPNFLRLLVQVFIGGDETWVRPNSKPGEPVDPPVDLARKARAIAVPDLERAFRRQIQILDRVLVNFVNFVHGRTPNPSDTWESLRPFKSALRTPIPAELTTKDSELLAEFYASVREVDDLLEAWITAGEDHRNYNIWNVLMHKAQHSLRIGATIVREFCPSRQYDACSPASGTLVSNADRVLTASDAARILALNTPDLSARLAKIGALPLSPPARAAIPGRPQPITPFNTSDPLAVYQRARDVARNGDVFAWRSLVSTCRDQLGPKLSNWLTQYLNQLPSPEQLVAQSMEAIELYTPLMAIGLGGVASMTPQYKDQSDVFEEVLHPPNWQRAGLVVRLELPMSAAFIFQALHGALCLYIEDVATAFRLARLRTQSPVSREPIPLWARHDVIMWPQALGHSADIAWKTISTLPERWSWVSGVFGNVRDYQSSLVAYYIALNTLEFLEFLAAGQKTPQNPAQLRCDIPPVFEIMPDEIKRGAYRALLKTREELRSFADELKLDQNLIRGQWPGWVAAQEHCLHQLYPFAMSGITQEELIPEVFGK